jgi:hypothetical protein
MWIMVWLYRLGLTPNSFTREFWQPPVIWRSSQQRHLWSEYENRRRKSELVYPSPWDFKRSLTCRKILQHETSPLKPIAFTRFEPATFGSSSKHTNHYTTKATTRYPYKPVHVLHLRRLQTAFPHTHTHTRARVSWSDSQRCCSDSSLAAFKRQEQWILLRLVTVKQSHYRPWRHLGGEDVYLLLILDLGTGWVWVVNATPRPRFTPGTQWAGAGWASKPVWTQRLEEKSFTSAEDRISIARSSSP